MKLHYSVNLEQLIELYSSRTNTSNYKSLSIRISVEKCLVQSTLTYVYADSDLGPSPFFALFILML